MWALIVAFVYMGTLMAFSHSKPVTEIRPQPGPQEAFCSSEADIVIYGGQAGGGKSYALLLEGGRNVDHPYYRGVIFRRTHTEIVAGGGLWDTARRVYAESALRGIGKDESLYVFPSGAQIRFSHMQHESDKNSHFGAQYSYIAFDELISFERSQFFFLLTRCRPPDGYDRFCYMRATTNPDASSWVLELIDWWIGEDGYPIQKRSGVLRYFTVEDDKIIWVSKNWRGPSGELPFSITYIPATVDDNPELLKRDPNYKRNLYAQDKITRERLLRGNWRITHTGGIFDPKWFEINIIERSQLPAGLKLCRYWDFAASKPEKGKDPAWTAGALCGTLNGDFYIIDIERFRETPKVTIENMQMCAMRDGFETMIAWEKEKGSAGALNAEHLSQMLDGYEVHPDPVSGDKVDRCKPLAALAEQGRVFLVKGAWNKPFLAEVGSFPKGKKDQVDSVNGAYKILAVLKKVWPEWRVGRVQNYSMIWSNPATRHCLHYGTLVHRPDMSMVYVAAAYDKFGYNLYVYDAAIFERNVPSAIALDVAQRSNLRTVKMERLMGNPEMFGDGAEIGMSTLINREFDRAKVQTRMSQAPRFEINGAIAFLGQMFSLGRVYISRKAMDVAVEAAGWCIDSSSGKPQKDKAFCLALCMIGSELRQATIVETPGRAKHDYHRAETAKVQSTGTWMSGA